MELISTNPRTNYSLFSLVLISVGTSLYRKIEYNKLVIDEDFYKSKEQIQLISLLSFIEFIAYLENMQLISLADVDNIFGYYIMRVYNNANVRKYRDALRELDNSSSVSFPNLEILSNKLKLLKE